MVEENIIQEVGLKNIYETRNSITDKIEQNELISKKHKKVSTTLLNYIEHHSYWIYFNFCFCLFGQFFSIGITSSAIESKSSAGIKKYKSMITKKRKKHDSKN